MLAAPRIGEAFLDGAGERHQELSGRRRAPRQQELAHPAVDLAGRVGISARDRRHQVGHLLGIVDEGIGLRPRLGAEIRHVVGVMVDANRALEPQFRRPRLEPRQRDAVAERVVDPVDVRRLRRDAQARVDQPLVVAVARAEHHAMVAERDRPAIAVGGDVTDREDGHGLVG